ncbi:MAG: hypothetical protein AAGJ18_14940 [Bacteroidota bacterium]
MIVPRFITPSVYKIIKNHPIIAVIGSRQSGKTTLLDDFNAPKLLEIKSTKTIMPHHFKGVAKFQKLFQNEPAQFFMAHGGDDSMIRSSGVKVISWRDLSEF